MTTLRRLATVGLGAALFAGSWSMGAAIADPPPPQLRLSSVAASDSAPISIDRMYPGVASTHPYVITMTDSAPDSRIAVGFRDLVDLERDCSHPETTSGDATCGEFDGEMSQQLLVSAGLTPGDDCDDDAAATEVLAPTPLATAAAAGVLDLDEVVTSGSERCLLLTFDLPFGADNLVQTDAATFDLVVYAEQLTTPTVDTPDETDVLGESIEKPGATGKTSSPSTLPFDLAVTGVPVLAVAAAGITALLGGVLVLWTSLRRAQGRRR